MTTAAQTRYTVHPLEDDCLPLIDLTRRLQLLDGYLPSEAIMRAFVERDEAARSMKTWRAVAALSVALALAATVAFGMLYVQAMRVAQHLAVYDGECISPKAADKLMVLMDRTARVNAACVTLHRDNRAFYRSLLLALPDSSGLYAAPERSIVLTGMTMPE